MYRLRCAFCTLFWVDHGKYFAGAIVDGSRPSDGNAVTELVASKAAINTYRDLPPRHDASSRLPIDVGMLGLASSFPPADEALLFCDIA
jgi:hypothetical protein